MRKRQNKEKRDERKEEIVIMTKYEREKIERKNR